MKEPREESADLSGLVRGAGSQLGGAARDHSVGSPALGSSTVRGLPHSAGYYAWQLRIRTRQYREAHHYARVLERYIRARRHPTPTRMLSSSSGGSVENAICVTFGNYCSQAVSVARCESELNVGASNGQYLGLFQMGEYARSRYGHSWDAWGQARAAYRYFRDSGYSWSPWTCQP